MEDRFNILMPQTIITKPFISADGGGIKQELFCVIPGIWYPAADRLLLSNLENKLADAGKALAAEGTELAEARAKG